MLLCLTPFVTLRKGQEQIRAAAADTLTVSVKSFIRSCRIGELNEREQKPVLKCVFVCVCVVCLCIRVCVQGTVDELKFARQGCPQ